MADRCYPWDPVKFNASPADRQRIEAAEERLLAGESVPVEDLYLNAGAPLWHGTTAAAASEIARSGFQVGEDHQIHFATDVMDAMNFSETQREPTIIRTYLETFDLTKMGCKVRLRAGEPNIVCPRWTVKPLLRIWKASKP